MKRSALFLISLSFILTSCFSYKEIELGDVKDVKLKKGNDGGADLYVSMQVDNPNNYKIKIKKIEADMLLNGNKVGKITLNKKVVLPKKSQMTQEFSVNTQLTNLIAAMPSLLFGGTVNLKLKGSIKGKVFIFSKSFPIEEERKISPSDLNLF